MKVPVNSIRAGNVIEYNGKLWVASKVEHISPGKGGAFVAIEAKALREGNKLQERFRSGETIEHVHIDDRECTFLFKDENGYTFMDKENFEQLVVGADVLDADLARFLQDGMEVAVSLYEGTPVGIELPTPVPLTVTTSGAITPAPSTAPATTSTTEWMPASTRDCATSSAIKKARVLMSAAWVQGATTRVMAIQAAKAAAAWPEGNPPRRGVPRPTYALTAMATKTVTARAMSTTCVGAWRAPRSRLRPGSVRRP